MMSKTYVSYPIRYVLISDLVSLLIYGLGLYIVSRLGMLWTLAFIAYILWLESRVLRSSCRYCYYYGKFCAFGKGKICALLFKKGDPKVFTKKKITWKDLLPDLMVVLIPTLCSTYLLLVHTFTWPLLTASLALIILGFMGNALVRGSIACKYCKQRQLGCPAEKLFNK